MNRVKFILLFIVINANFLFGQEYERYKKLVDTTIFSEALGFEKNLTITVPFEWQKDTERDFPLVIIFDRQNQRSHNYILNTIDYLTSNEQMPSSVIISIESEQKYRYLETLHKASSEKGLALENEAFLFDELIPMAEKHFRASNFRLFVGHSRYGYFTTSLLFSRIDQLNGIISLSPFFIQDNVDLTDSIVDLKTLKFNSLKYYRYGIGNDYPKQFFKMDSTLNVNRISSVDMKGWLFQEADHNVTPGLTISRALYEIFEKWSNIQSHYFSNDQKDLSSINMLKEEIIKNYGSNIEFSLGVLNGKGWYFYGEGEYKKAIEAWEILLKSYPNFSEAYLYIIDAQIQLEENYDSTTEQFKESLNESKIYSDIDKIELLQELDTMKNPE